jgi:hypothetical protein
MPSDPAHQFNPSPCQADFAYTMTVRATKIQDTGKGTKSIVKDLETVLRKIAGWRQGPVANYKISCHDTQGREVRIEWNGQRARILS